MRHGITVLLALALGLAATGCIPSGPPPTPTPHPRFFDAQQQYPTGLGPVGLAVHIGSQITSLDPPREAFGRVAELVRVLRLQGHAVERLDLGGGLGIRYRDETPPDVADYGRMVRETVGDLGCTLVFEPGRWLVGNAGMLLARVIYVKEGEHRRFLVLDAAMNDLKRPAMYDDDWPMRALTLSASRASAQNDT